ncbi:MAG: endolytic transglycosylase MltG [Acidobacteria bacterium]|nr:endolytic transglycosylase MltG [Acidobacteriota bacterium]
MIKRLLVAVAALGFLGLLAILNELYRPYQGYSGGVLVVVDLGTRAHAVAERLVAEGVLPHRLPFLVRYWVSRPSRTLKAGEYRFDRPLRPIDVYWKLVQGETLLYSVVIPEGADRFDMARIFSENFGIKREDFLRVTEQASAIHDLDPAAPSLEGYLFPDTYRFSRGVSSATLVATMLARFRRILETRFPAELRQDSGRLHEVITLASMVEKETSLSDERPIIAGVFAKRLERGWLLQCDPTVVYAGRLNERPVNTILQSDLEFDSPYNTYAHAGLPPGPISSPGEASMRAALDPADGDFLYFVSNHQGGHVFSKTLAEHQRNVARYRRQVAALRRVQREEAKQSARPGSSRRRGETDTTSSSREGGKQSQQKATDP